MPKSRRKTALLIVAVTGFVALGCCVVFWSRIGEYRRKLELIAMLKNDVSEWNSWRGENPELELNFRGANLAEADLDGADLHSVDLRGANFSRADLDRAILAAADLRGADLSRARLRLTDLRGAKLSGAVFRGADVREANLNGANVDRAIFIGANLARADLSSIREWELAILFGANIYKINNPPPGLIDFAEGQGAVSERTRMLTVKPVIP